MGAGTKKVNTDGASSGGGVQSLHRAVSILEAIARSRTGVGLADLSKEVGLHTSTAFHLAKTLVTLGIARQDADSKKYHVGPRLFSLASGALDERELLDVSFPLLAQLAEQTGENSHIAVVANREVVIIGRCDGTATIRLAERIGAPRPFHATAIGKVLLAGYHPEELERTLASLELRQITPRTMTDPESFAAAIDDVRESGIAFDDGELDPDVRCLAAPVYDFTGRVIAAIGISGPVWRMGLGRVSQVKDLVQTAATTLSQKLGHTG